MDILINRNGTDRADLLEYNKGGVVVYHAGAGNDLINITAGNNVKVQLDSGKNTVNLSGGKGHTIQIAATEAEGNAIVGDDTLTIANSDQIMAYLGSGKDLIQISNSDGKRVGGALSQIRGGDWGDTFTIGENTRNYQLYGDKGDDKFQVKGGSSLNLWGGSGRDEFKVYTGGTNKLYGGDSEDSFDIYAAGQEITLGYGGNVSLGLYDTVNIHAGDNQVIYGNLGINKINLYGGQGHIIKADIDRTASRKAGYTEDQLSQGIGLGYGVDNILIDGASGVTANTGDGKDVVVVKNGSNHQLYTEGWGDTISVEGPVSDSSFDAGAGDDTYVLDWSKLGNNNIIDQTTAMATDRDRLIIKNAQSNSFTGQLVGQDFIITDKTTQKTLKILSWGKGMDTITFDDGAVDPYDLIRYGDENNYIDVRRDGKTIDTKGGKDTISVYGKNNTVKAGEGNDTLQIYGSGNNIDAGEGDDLIYVKAEAYNNRITGGEGMDTIDIRSKLGNTLYCDKRDTIVLYGDNNTLYWDKLYSGYMYGKGDNNSFYSELGMSLRLSKGSGYRELQGNNNVFHFGQGFDSLTLDGLEDGLNNNTVYIDDLGSAPDEIAITSRDISEFSLEKNGAGYVLKDLVKGGILNLNSAQGDFFLDIKFKDSQTIKLRPTNSSTGPLSPLQVMHRFMSFYDKTNTYGKPAFDEAIGYASNYYYKDFQELYDALDQDIKQAEAQDMPFDQLLMELYGVDLNNQDTGAITGYDANRGPVQDLQNVIVQPEGMTLEDFVYDTSHTMTLSDYSYKELGGSLKSRESYYVDIDGVRFYWTDYNLDQVAEKSCADWDYYSSLQQQYPDKAQYLAAKKADMQLMLAGITTSWAKGAMDKIKESYGLSLTAPDASINRSEGLPLIQLGFTYAPNGGFAAVTYGGSGVFIAINFSYFEQIGDVNGARKTSYFVNTMSNLENTFTHEMTHATLMSNINGYSTLPFFIKEGSADLVTGGDEIRGINIMSTAADLSAYIDLDFLTRGFGVNSYAGGYLLLRYLAKTASEASGFAFADSAVAANEAEGMAFDFMGQKDKVLLTYSNDKC